MVNREFATFFMFLPPRQGDPCKRSAHSGTVVVHVPLPRVRRAIIHEGRVKAVGRGVVEQEGNGITSYGAAADALAPPLHRSACHSALACEILRASARTRGPAATRRSHRGRFVGGQWCRAAPNAQ